MVYNKMSGDNIDFKLKNYNPSFIETNFELDIENDYIAPIGTNSDFNLKIYEKPVGKEANLDLSGEKLFKDIINIQSKAITNNQIVTIIENKIIDLLILGSFMIDTHINMNINHNLSLIAPINIKASIQFRKTINMTSESESIGTINLLLSQVSKIIGKLRTKGNANIFIRNLLSESINFDTEAIINAKLDNMIGITGLSNTEGSITPHIPIFATTNAKGDISVLSNHIITLSSCTNCNFSIITQLADEIILSGKGKLKSSINTLLSFPNEVVGLKATVNINIKVKDDSIYSLFQIIPPYTSDGSNQTIYLLDEDLNIIAQLDDLEYFNWTRRWRKHDSFELKINRHKENAKKITIGNYIALKRGDIVRGGKIQHRELEINNSGKAEETWKFAGKSGDGILNKRIAANGTQTGDGYDAIEAPAETVMKHYVNVNVINPDDNDRKFNKLVMSRDRGRGPTTAYRARFQDITEILESVSLTSGLGWDIKLDLDSKKFIFKVLEGEDKSNITLSTKFDNVKMLGFRESEFQSENVVYVGGAGEGADRNIVKVEK